MADLPILPLKTDALLSDTGHLSAEEFGAYCRILFTMWRHEARLPDDHVELARIAGVSPRRWAAISEKVMRPLTVAGGLISQKRLTATWLDVQELRKKRAHAANSRWTSKQDAKDMQVHMQVQSNSNANQNQIGFITTTSSGTARARGAEKPIKQDKSAGSLATALPTGALARQPFSEQAEERRAAERAKVGSASLAKVIREKGWAGG